MCRRCGFPSDEHPSAQEIALIEEEIAERRRRDRELYRAQHPSPQNDDGPGSPPEALAAS